jgi:hypothetical protein
MPSFPANRPEPKRFSRNWWRNWWEQRAPWTQLDDEGLLAWRPGAMRADNLVLNDPNPYWNWWKAQP